jgi:aryl-alcohol dehydrogenase-like predicted oxidoreductase
MGWSQFVALQVEYSLLQRSPERDLIPMASHFEMSLLPWAPLAGGALTGKYLKGNPGRIKPESKRLNENSVRITKEVIDIADKYGVPASSVALAWTRQQYHKCIPIVGATKIDQLAENLQSLELELEPAFLQRLNDASQIDLGFPGDFFQEPGVRKNNFGGFYDQIIKR